MWTGFLHLHSIFRYLIIIVAIIAIVKAFSGKNSNRPFTKGDKMSGLFYMILMDIQLLIGFALYFFKPGSGWDILKNNDFGAIMGDSMMRFFVVEHLLGMFIAFILVHIGYAATKKNVSDQKKFSKSFILYLIAFIIMLVSIPWPFRDLGRGWMPGM